MKISIGVYCAPYGTYTYSPAIKTSVNYKFTELELSLADKIIVFDDSEKIGFEWNRSHPANADNKYNLVFVRILSNRMMSSTLTATVDKILPVTKEIMDKLSAIILFVKRIDSLDQSILTKLKNEIIKVIVDYNISIAK
jgi:hypothetical protein